MQFHVGRQLFIGFISHKGAPGGNDEELDRGGGEVGRGAESSKSVVDKHVCRRDEWTTSRSAREQDGTKYLTRRVSDFWDTLSIKREGRKTLWKKECNMQTWLGVEM